MSDYTVTYWSGRDGDIQMRTSAPNAETALALAQRSGSGATITTPDGDTYDITDFRTAYEAGEFRDA